MSGNCPMLDWRPQLEKILYADSKKEISLQNQIVWKFYDLPIRVQTTLSHNQFVFSPQYQMIKIMFRIDLCSVVRTLIDNGKLANQAARLAAIVFKTLFLLSVLFDSETQFNANSKQESYSVAKSNCLQSLTCR